MVGWFVVQEYSHEYLVLMFTNTAMSPHFLQVLIYCGTAKYSNLGISDGMFR